MKQPQVGCLFGFNSVMILPIFQRCDICQCCYEKLAMFVSVVVPWGPRCFKCMFDMLSGPMADEFLVYFMTHLVCSVVASIIVGSSVNSCLRLMVRRSSLSLGK